MDFLYRGKVTKLAKITELGTLLVYPEKPQRRLMLTFLSQVHIELMSAHMLSEVMVEGTDDDCCKLLTLQK